MDSVEFDKEIGKGLLNHKQNNEEGYNFIVEAFCDNHSIEFLLKCEKLAEEFEYGKSHHYED